MAAWIVQNNADKVDLDGLLAASGSVLLGAKRFADRIAVGDRVFVWRARGRTRLHSGIIALGTVSEEPLPRVPERPEFYRSAARDSIKPRFRLRLEEVRPSVASGMIPREDVRKLPEMDRHPIVTANTGTDFVLSPDQADALLALWEAHAGA